MRIWTREQAQAMDRSHIEMGRDSIHSLVGKAGDSWTQSFESTLRPFIEQSKGPVLKILILCGPGLNGADGWRIAKNLKQKGYSVHVCFMQPPPDSVGAALKAECVLAGLICEDLDRAALLKFSDQGGLLIVDALFGIGLNRKLSPEVQDWISLLNSKKFRSVPKVAVDIPTGIDANTGHDWGISLRCAATITLGALKPGLLMSRGRLCSGKIEIAPLPFAKSNEQQAIQKNPPAIFTLGPNLARRLLPSVKSTDHKYSRGELYVLAGSHKYPGAALLTVKAALRAGCGYIHLLSSESLPASVLQGLPEVIHSKESVAELMERIRPKLLDPKKSPAFVIGPGLNSPESLNFASELLAHLIKVPHSKIVIDASALACIENLGKLPNSWIWTPHSGEASRLIDLDAKEIEQNRLAGANLLQKKFGGTLILKGAQSLIAQNGSVWMNLSGNAGLAKAGTGDVLSGILGAFLARPDFRAISASLLAVWLHGWLANRWVARPRDSLSLTSSDLIEDLPQALAALRAESLKSP